MNTRFDVLISVAVRISGRPEKELRREAFLLLGNKPKASKLFDPISDRSKLELESQLAQETDAIRLWALAAKILQE